MGVSRVFVASWLMIIALSATMAAAAAKPKGNNQHLWRDSAFLSNIWTIINGGKSDELRELLESDKTAATTRSADGRGALWWAYEYGRDDMVQMLLAAGANPDDTDADGKKPSEVQPGATKFMQENPDWAPDSDGEEIKAEYTFPDEDE